MAVDNSPSRAEIAESKWQQREESWFGRRMNDAADFINGSAAIISAALRFDGSAKIEQHIYNSEQKEKAETRAARVDPVPRETMRASVEIAGDDAVAREKTWVGRRINDVKDAVADPVGVIRDTIAARRTAADDAANLASTRAMISEGMASFRARENAWASVSHVAPVQTHEEAPAARQVMGL